MARDEADIKRRQRSKVKFRERGRCVLHGPRVRPTWFFDP